MGKQTLAHFSPGRVILSTIILAIFLGTFFLWLPIARTKPIALIDLFFTATSATCVTGLFTIPLSDFTFFGHVILLVLIQLGGLGLVTMTLFLLSLFLDVGMATQHMAGQLLEVSTWKQIKRLLIFTIVSALIFELLGTALLYPLFKGSISSGKALFYSFFYAISSFCNAGISIFPSFAAPIAHPMLLLTITGALILFGGLGFITMYEMLRYTAAQVSDKRFRLSLHTRIILYVTAVTLVIGTLLFVILEHKNTLAGLSPLRQAITALFHVISFRSTGFSTISPHNMQLATLFVIMGLAFIGSAPGSTGSGIKLTTVALFLATVKAAITGRTSVEIQGRTLPKDLVYKSIAIVFLSMAWIALTTFCLLISESNWLFLDLLFEATSAFTNLGLSTSNTALLSPVGKILICLSMIIGRVGSLTLVLALKIRKRNEPTEFTYPEERVMLG